MITLVSPCCKAEGKYADANSEQYGCVSCGSGFTIEQAKAAAAPVVEETPAAADVPAVDAPAQDPAPAATDAPADPAAAPSSDTPAAQ